MKSFLKKETARHIGVLLFMNIFVLFFFHTSFAEEEVPQPEGEISPELQEEIETFVTENLEDILEQSLESDSSLETQEEFSLNKSPVEIFEISQNTPDEFFKIAQTKKIFSEEFKSVVEHPVLVHKEKIEDYEKRIYQGDIDTEDMTPVSCVFEDITKIQMKYKQSSNISIFLPENIGEGVVEIGSLPRGFDMFFSDNSTKQINYTPELKSINFTIRKGENPQKGSFIIPIFFQHLEGNQISICQINLVN